MNNKMKIAAVLYIINIIGMLGIGFVYVFGSEFMPYHSDVIQTLWSDVPPQQQILYLGMMRTEGAGFLACALALTILLIIPFKQGMQWSFWAIPLVGIVEYLPTLLATYHVASVTSSHPPWPAVALSCVLFILGAILTVQLNKNDN